MLPPNDYNEYEGEYPFDRESYNHDVFDSYNEAVAMYEYTSEYFHDTGFSNDEWFSMIREIIYNEDGTFDVSWSSDDGEYSGVYHGG